MKTLMTFFISALLSMPVHAKKQLELEPLISTAIANTIVAAHFSGQSDGSTAIEEGSTTILRINTNTISTNASTIECRTTDNYKNIQSANCIILDRYNRL